MKVFTRALIYLVLSFVFATTIAAQTAPRTESVLGRDAIAGEVIVQFRLADSAQSQARARQDADIVSTQQVGMSGAVLIRSQVRSATTLLQAYGSRPDVVYAEPNYLWNATDIPNDAYFPLQFGLRNTGQAILGQAGVPGADIKATDAWDRTMGTRSIVVGVVDTGVTYNHPDLAANIWSAPSAFTVMVSGQLITCAAGTHGFNAIKRTCDPMDDSFHGTHVSGIIGASGNNGFGVSGVSPIASIMGLKFLDDSGSGSTADAIAAIDFAIAVKAHFGAAANVRVLNNSWGGSGFSQALLDEINLAGANDMLFAAAAGNALSDNDIVANYPSNYNAPNIIAVAATDNRDALAFFSNFGATTVHLGAPGVDVLSTFPKSVYQYLSGTSMATPMVAGAAALVLSSCSLSTVALKGTLLSSVDSIPGLFAITSTGGRLNVSRALENCAGPEPASFTISAQPGIGNVSLNAPASVLVTVKSVNGFANTVSLTPTGLPPGMTASFSPPSITGGSGSSTMTLITTGVPAGSYVIHVTGTSGPLSRMTAVGLNLGPPMIESITPPGGIAGVKMNVSIQGTGLENGATAVAFSGSGITPAIGTTDFFQGLAVTLDIASNAPAGTQTLTVTTPLGTSAPFDGFYVIVPSTINPGQSISASLTTTDPMDPFSPAFNSDFYELTISSTTQITIDMRSTSFDTWLGLISPSGDLILSSSSSGGGNNARMFATLSPGKYYIDASSEFKGETGPYTLSVNVLPVLSNVAPSFGATGTSVAVVLTGNRFESSMTVAAGSGITVKDVNVLSSSSATATFDIAPGTAAGTNNVTVTTSAGTSNPWSFAIFPVITAISPGQTLSAMLNSADGRNPFSKVAGVYADLYRLTLDSTTEVTIDMKSTAFSPSLYLVSASGSILNLDTVRIRTTLAAGIYYVLSTSSNSGITGAYAISINVLPVLTSLSPRFGKAGDSIAVTLSGERFAAPITVAAGTGISVSNVNLLNSTSATVFLNIAAGTVVGTNEVTVTTPEGMSNSLPFSIFPMISAISLGQTIAGILETTDGRSPFSPAAFPESLSSGSYADLYQLTLASTTQVTINMNSTVFPPSVYVTAASGSFQIGGTAEIQTTLAAGTYYIVASTGNKGATGAYTLLVNVKPTLLSVSPSFGAAGSSTSVTLAGDRFLSPMTVNAGTGVTVSDLTILSASSATAKFNIVAGAFGKNSVTVTTSAGTSAASTLWIFPEITAMSTGQTITGRLDTTDGRDPVFGNAYADLYELTLSSTTQVAINMTSTTFSPLMSLFSTSGFLILSNNPQVTTTLVAGTYYVAATSTTAGLTGGYTISMNAAPVLSSIVRSFGAAGTAVAVALTGNRFASPMSVNAGSMISVGNVNVLSSTSATATFNIAPGAAASVNDVTVTTPTGTSRPLPFSVFPMIPAITPGQTISATLDDTDGRNPLAPATNPYADFYELTLANETEVRIKLKSPFFNTFLYVLSSSGSFLYSDSGPDSGITTTLGAGTYFIVASSLSDTSGPYTLSINPPAVKKVRGQITSQ